jgi:hypothetical protein
MHPREQLLQKAAYLKRSGQPLPVDVLAEADRLGILLSDFCDQTTKLTQSQGDNTSWHQNNLSSPNKAQRSTRG